MTFKIKIKSYFNVIINFLKKTKNSQKLQKIIIMNKFQKLKLLKTKIKIILIN